MTTVAEMIEFLSQFPPETEIEVLKERSYLWTTVYDWVPLDLGEHTHLIDMRGSPYIKPEHPNAGKCFLQLGEK